MFPPKPYTERLCTKHCSSANLILPPLSPRRPNVEQRECGHARHDRGKAFHLGQKSVRTESLLDLHLPFAHTLIFSSSTTRPTADRLSIRSLNAVAQVLPRLPEADRWHAGGTRMVLRSLLRPRSIRSRLLHLGCAPRAADGRAQELHFLDSREGRGVGCISLGSTDVGVRRMYSCCKEADD